MKNRLTACIKDKHTVNRQPHNKVSILFGDCRPKTSS